MASKGLPGLRGTDHIGLTVPDLDEAAGFFENVLGFEPFHDPRPEPFEQRIGPFAEAQHQIPALRPLEIDGNRRPAAIHQVVPGRHGDAPLGIVCAVDAIQFGAHVGQQHPAKLARARTERQPYSPMNSGLRLSMKAVTASLRSAVMLVTVS